METFTLADLIAPQELPIQDRLGTFKKAELLVDRFELASDLAALNRNISQGMGTLSVETHVSYYGKLSDGSLVRAAKIPLYPNPIVETHRTAKELWSLEVGKQARRIMETYPASGDILPVFWFSEHTLPRQFRRDRYVTVAMLGPQRELIFRKAGTSLDDSSGYFEDFSLFSESISYFGLSAESHDQVRELRANESEEVKRHAQRELEPMRKIVSAGETAEALRKYVAESRAADISPLLAVFDTHAGAFTDPVFSRAFVASFDVERALARMILNVPKTQSIPGSFDLARQRYYTTLANELSERGAAGALLGVGDLRYCISLSLHQATNALFGSSVQTAWGGYQGGERRKLGKF